MAPGETLFLLEHLHEPDTASARGLLRHTVATLAYRGGVADALTHIGQIAMLRRLACSPVRGENYFKAAIVAGRVGPEQAGPRVEFA